MATTDNSEWTLYATDLTTVLEPVLPVSTSHLYLELNEAGSGELRIPLDTRAAGLVTVGMFAACSYRGSYRGGFFVDNIKETQADASEHGGRWMSISGVGAMALLAREHVLGDGTTSSTREFTAKTKAYVLKTIIDEVITAGGLGSLDYDFTATDDSNSAAWTDSSDYTLTVGSTILDVLRQFAKTDTEFSMSFSAGTFTLSAYQTEIGADKSETVFFRTGGNCEEISSDERGGDIANVITVGYKSGNTTVQDATSIAAYGRRAKYIDARIAQSLSSASTYATAQLQVTKDPRKSISVRVYDGVKPYLFTDYTLGDYVTLDVMGTETKYRVLGLQCDFDGVAYSNVVVEMNTIIHDAQLEVEERLAWLTQQWKTANEDNKLETIVWGKLTLNCDDQIRVLHLSGDTLYIGGDFTTIGPITTANGFATVNVKTGVWDALGTGAGTGGEVYAICEDTSGNIYVGGSFTTFNGVSTQYIAMWNGTVWAAVGSATALGDEVRALVASGTNIYIGGAFSDAGGVAEADRIAKWDGAVYTALGDPTPGGGYVNAIAVFGTDIYIGGDFTEIASVAGTSRVAKWNGSAWSALNTGLGGTVYALAINSSGQLYAGGAFTNAGGVAAADRIALWNGSAWLALGTGFASGTVRVIHIDVYGNVYVGGSGSLHTINGITVNHVGRWTGSTWLALGTTGYTGTDGDVYALETSTTGDIYIGGYFYRAGNIVADAAGAGLQIAVYLTTFNAVIDYVNSGAGNIHPPVTIGTANGLSITDNQVLSLTSDASTVTYTPTTLADWDGSADPGDVNDALDQLAARVKALEP